MLLIQIKIKHWPQLVGCVYEGGYNPPSQLTPPHSLVEATSLSYESFPASVVKFFKFLKFLGHYCVRVE